MKEGWTYKKLGEVATFARGLTYSKNDEAESSSKVVLRSNNIDLIAGKLDFSELKYLKETYDIPSDKRIKRGSLFICMSNGSKAHLGKVAYIDKDYNYAFGGFMGQITPTEEVDGLFLHYALCSPNYKAYIKSLSEGANINNLKFKDLSEFPLCYPSLSEQRAIVARLDSAFAQIDSLKANAEKQLSEARQLFQKALEEAMTPKEGWEEKTLGEIAQIKIGPFGSLLHKKDYISGGIPLVNPVHMIEGKIKANHDFSISEDKAKELSNYILKENDIILARRGEVGRCALVSSNENNYLCGTGSMFVRFDKEVDYSFMLLMFSSKMCKDYLEKHATGATMPNINSVIVSNMPLMLPPLSTQHSIVAHLDALSSNVRALEEKLKKMKDECDVLKQAMLREVLE